MSTAKEDLNECQVDQSVSRYERLNDELGAAIEALAERAGRVLDTRPSERAIESTPKDPAYLVPLANDIETANICLRENIDRLIAIRNTIRI